MSGKTTKLLPCPFCGVEAETHETIDGWIASCSSEQSELDGFTHMANAYGDTEAEAIAAWNIRAVLGSGTCEIVSSRFDEMMDEWCIELSCGHCVWNRTDPPNYCEECGAKIRKAVGE